MINGPIPYAPDGLPLIGPMPGVPNAFEACVFTFGIAQSGGAGKVLAEWITEGETEWDMWAVDPRRYTDYTDQEYCDRQGVGGLWQRIRHAFSRHEWPAARATRSSRRLTAKHASSRAASWGPITDGNGSIGSRKPGDDTSEEATHTWDREGPVVSPASVRNARPCATAVGVHRHLPGFSRFKILTGDGAADEWLRGHGGGRACPRSGASNLGLFLRRPRADPDGDVRSSREAMRIASRSSPPPAPNGMTATFSSKALPEDVALTLDRLDDAQLSTLIVTGPKSRETLIAGMSHGRSLNCPG